VLSALQFAGYSNLKNSKPSVVVHTNNPSYWKGGDWEDLSLRPH
jgi:hypothetical protein